MSAQAVLSGLQRIIDVPLIVEEAVEELQNTFMSKVGGWITISLRSYPSRRLGVHVLLLQVVDGAGDMYVMPSFAVTSTGR